MVYKKTLLGALFQGVLSAIFGMTFGYFFLFDTKSFEVLSESPTKETFLYIFLLLLFGAICIYFYLVCIK